MPWDTPPRKRCLIHPGSLDAMLAAALGKYPEGAHWTCAACSARFVVARVATEGGTSFRLLAVPR